MHSGAVAGLELGHSGWIHLDAAALRVSGGIDKIVREMDEVLSGEAVRALCSSLGIMCTGFLFFDLHRSLIVFFEEECRFAPKTYRTHYLWQTPQCERWSELVHWLFVHVRDVQRRHADTAKLRSEDYFRCIPVDDDNGQPFAEQDCRLRNRYGLHYVTLGEMLFTLLAWRSVTVAIELHGPAADLGKLPIPLNQPVPGKRECKWDDMDLLEHASGLVEAWTILNRPNQGLWNDWELLGVTAAARSSHTAERAALIKFAQALELGRFSAGMPDEELSVAIQQSVPSFLKRLGWTQTPDSLGDARLAIERYARFPLLPFYVWSGLDRAAKCYIVSPVWTSQQYTIDVQRGRCRHLGLSLSGVAPMLRIDWTLAEGCAASPLRYSDADPTVLTNVLRLMARPLVEAHLYAEVVRVMQTQHSQLTQAADQEVGRAIENSGRVCDNSLAGIRVQTDAVSRDRSRSQ